jgi:hypothetical protein
MKIYQKALILLSLTGLMVSCGPSTKLEKSWTDPSLKSAEDIPFTKVFVMAATKDASSNRIVEDKLAAAIENATAVQSYTYLKPEDTDQAQIEEKLRKDGFDGLIIMRLKNVELSQNYVPGSSYGGWYGYRYGSPGYVTTDETFTVETNIYSLKDAKLLWSGTTSTLNPTKMDNTIDAIISTIKYELKRKKLIK